jgi:hypothetical protein
MRFFTSSSEQASPGITRGIVLWIFVVAVLLIGMETATRFGFDRYSKLQRRVSTERLVVNEALRKTSSVPTILIVGNSLLLEGVDFGALQEALQPVVRSYPYIVTQTEYLDWYYGLERLFREGVRPTYVLLGLSPSQIVRSSTRGEFSAYYLFDLPGLIDYGRREHVGLTVMSGLVFAHFSQYYAVRAEIRATLVEKLFPSYADALHGLTVAPAQKQDATQLESVTTNRLRQFKDLCGQYGVTPLFVLPPTDQSTEAPVLAAGRNAHVPVLLPVSRASLESSDFADGFHLNAHGRSIFTPALAENLKAILADKTSASMGSEADSHRPPTANIRSRSITTSSSL